MRPLWLFALAACAPEPAPAVEETAVPAEEKRYWVIATPELAGAAQAFADYRETQGWTSEVHITTDLAPEGDVDTLVSSVQALLVPDAEIRQAVLLLGDATQGLPAAPCATPDQFSSTCIAEFEGDFPWADECLTDFAYGSLDGDALPDVAVGRVPALSESQAIAYLERVIAYEQQRQPGEWDRKIQVYLGESGWDPSVEEAATTVVMSSLGALEPRFSFQAAWNNPNNPYYYAPFADKVQDFFSDGAYAVFYIGHGQATYQDGLSAYDLQHMTAGPRTPFAFFIACNNGILAGDSPSIAARAIFSPNGPITTYASSTVSSPFPNATLPYEMERHLVSAEHLTVGETIVAAERDLLMHTDEMRDLLAVTSLALSPFSEECLEIQDPIQLELYNLFGDPAILSHTAAPLALEASDTEGTVQVHGTAPFAEGEAIVTVELELGAYVGDLSTNTDQASIQANWETVNRPVLAEQSVTVVDGAFSTTLTYDPDLVPSNTEVWVKTVAWNEEQSASGAVIP